MTGYFTLQETERAVSERLGGLALDVEANRAISNLHRAAAAARNHMEQSVLRDVDLTWTGFVVLWVVWIWENIETRHVAEECGISKGTLTGVATTLEKRGLLSRATPENDRRLSVLSLTGRGQALMTELFPRFNAEESYLVSTMGTRRVEELTRSLRQVVNHLDDSSDRQASVRHAIQATTLPALASGDHPIKESRTATPAASAKPGERKSGAKNKADAPRKTSTAAKPQRRSSRSNG